MKLVLVALAVLAIAGAFVVAKARRLKARHRRAFESPPREPPPDKAPLVVSPRALYHGTRFADGAKVLVADWADACVADLSCTEDAIFLQREAEGRRLVIPLADVREADIHRAFAPIAGKDLPMLRLRWTKGGELLETELSMEGGVASLERLRREIHLRQANVAEQVAALYRTPPGR